MKLTVETGEGLPDANSYIGEADALGGLPSRHIEEWNALAPDDRADRLAAASQFIDAAFSWVGRRKTLEQGMAWPRAGAVYQGHIVPDDTVPKAIKRASIMALILIKEMGMGVFMPTGEAAVKKEKMAAIETEYFEPGMAHEHKSRFEGINNALKGFYAAPRKGGVASSEVARA